MPRTTPPLEAPTRRIASWHPATVGQWPGRVATVIELWGCSFTCPGCAGMRSEPSASDLPQWPDIVLHVEGNRDIIDSIVVTGGEPLEDPDLPSLLAVLCELGKDVCLETNGSRPEVLSYLLAEGLVDCVALDIKAVPARYRTVSGERDMAARVAECADMLIGSGTRHEFRTTLTPGLVTPDDLPSIARTLAGGELYVVQRRASWHHDADATCPDTAVLDAARACQRFLPTVVRGLAVGRD